MNCSWRQWIASKYSGIQPDKVDCSCRQWNTTDIYPIFILLYMYHICFFFDIDDLCAALRVSGIESAFLQRALRGRPVSLCTFISENNVQTRNRRQNRRPINIHLL